MPCGLLYPQVVLVNARVVVRLLAEAVIAAEAVDVACKGGEVGASKDGGARAHDALDHAKEVRVDTLERALLLVVVQEANFPTRVLESLPARGVGAADRALAYWVALTGLLESHAVFADSLWVVRAQVHEGAARDEGRAVGVDQVLDYLFSTDLDLLKLRVFVVKEREGEGQGQGQGEKVSGVRDRDRERKLAV